MLKHKVALWIAVPTFAAVLGAGISVDSRLADNQAATKARVWTNEQCLQCHTDKRTLSLMQSKRGDPTYCQAAYDQLTKGGAASAKSGYGTK